MLDASDKLWSTVRHQHFGHASRHIASAVSDLQEKERRVNAQGPGGVKDMETSQIRRMLQTLPQYQYVGVCDGKSTVKLCCTHDLSFSVYCLHV